MGQDNCVFCKIVDGVIPSSTIYEDEDFKVILDISPASKGHAIIIPKTHVENVFELPENLASKVFAVASKVAKAMKAELQCDGFNILQNNGEVAGQTVFHFHMHLIPRYKEDQVTIKWCPGQYVGEDLTVTAEAIKKRIEH